MYNCPQCFWSLHQGHGWEQAISVAAAKRMHICQQVGIEHIKIPDKYQGVKKLGLGRPSNIDCKSVLAQGGGACWFSSLFYPLVGQKSGNW